jgi:hypothetical protein
MTMMVTLRVTMRMKIKLVSLLLLLSPLLSRAQVVNTYGPLNLPNTWHNPLGSPAAVQTFQDGVIFGNITGLTQCLRVNSSGVVSGTGADCGSGGGGVSIIVNGGSGLASPVNFQNGSNTTVTNPSGSNVQYNVASTGASTLGVIELNTDLGGSATAPTVVNGSHITNTSIPNNGLVNSAITIAGISVSLGGSTSALPVPGPIGGTTPSTGAFTSLSASGTVSGVGFSNYLASPPAIGGVSPAAGTFSTLTDSGITGSTQCLHVNSSGLVSGTGSDCGAGGGAVSSVFGRTGAVVAVNTDYGSVGIQQVGTGTLWFQKQTAGQLLFGDSVANGNNFFQILTDGTGGTAFLMQDTDLDQFSLEHSIGTNSVIPKSHGYEMNANPSGGSPGTKLFGNVTDIAMLIPGIAATDLVAFDINATRAIFNLPVNFANAAGFQIGGSYGSVGQCVVSTGTTVGFGSCAGGVTYAVDQLQVGTGAGTSSLFTAVQGAVAYNTFSSGIQGFYQAGCPDLSNGCDGSGQFVLKTGATLINPIFQGPTTNNLTVNGTGPTQIQLTYSGTTPNSPTASTSYLAVDANGALWFSSNAGNYFHPGPSSGPIDSICGGSLGTSNGVAYIMFPANQNTTTCAASTIGANAEELPFPATGTVQNLYCISTGNGSAGDVMTVYHNSSPTSLSCAIGTASSAHDTTTGHAFTVAAGDTWSVRYVTNAANDSNTGMRASFEYVRTP